MKLKGILATLVLMLTVGGNLIAQDSTVVDDCAKFRSLYFEYSKHKEYADAANFWRKAIIACGETGLDAKFYYNGRVIYSKLLTDSTDPARAKEINDTIDMCFERRMKYIDDPAWTVDYGIKLVSDGSENIEKIDSLFDNSIHRLKENLSSTATKQYFKHLIVNKFNGASPENKEIERTRIIEEYITLSEYVALAVKKAKEAGDENEVKRQESAQAFLDKYFLMIAKDCEVLTPVLDDKLKSLPQEKEAKLKKVKDYLTLMDLQKCQSSATYGKFVDTLIALEPTADAYYFGYNYAIGTGNEAKALKYIEKAVELEKEGENRDKYLAANANLLYKMNAYKSAFNIAQKVGSGEYKGEALYIQALAIAATANSCGDSTFERKANFWLANDYINRAIANGKTGVSSGKFLDNAPDKNEIFTEGVQMGSSYSLKCWGETTTVR